MFVSGPLEYDIFAGALPLKNIDDTKITQSSYFK